MKKKRMPAKSKKGIKRFLISVCTVGGFLLTFYMFFVSPTKKDIRRIEDLVRASASQTRATIPVWVPDSNKKIDNAELENLERDIKKVESSFFFSLSSQTYLDIAIFFFDQVKFRKSLEYVNKSIQKTPLNSKSLMLRSILQFYAGLFPAALDDITIVLEKGSDDKYRAIAQVLKGVIFSLNGNSQSAKDALINAVSSSPFLAESKELLLLSNYLISSACFDLGEYDTGDNYYSRSFDVAKQLESQEKKDSFTTIVLTLINMDSNFKAVLDNYDNLIKRNDEGIFRDLFLLLYRIAMSANDLEALSTSLEKAVEFCENYEIYYLQQVFSEMLFEFWLDYKQSFRKDLWEEIVSGQVKIPAIEADMYLAAGKFYQEQKDNESALSYLNIALERYTKARKISAVIDTKISICFAQSALKNYYSSTKILRSALSDINGLLKQYGNKSYVSKRANAELDIIRAHKEGAEKLLPVFEDILR